MLCQGFTDLASSLIIIVNLMSIQAYAKTPLLNTQFSHMTLPTWITIVTKDDHQDKVNQTQTQR